MAHDARKRKLHQTQAQAQAQITFSCYWVWVLVFLEKQLKVTAVIFLSFARVVAKPSKPHFGASFIIC